MSQSLEQLAAKLQNVTTKLATEAILNAGGRPDQIAQLYPYTISDDGDLQFSVGGTLLPAADAFAHIKQESPHLFNAAPEQQPKPVAPSGLGGTTGGAQTHTIAHNGKQYTVRTHSA